MREEPFFDPILDSLVMSQKLSLPHGGSVSPKLNVQVLHIFPASQYQLFFDFMLKATFIDLTMFAHNTVCRDCIPFSEWSKYVPQHIVDTYQKFNQPYRSFSRFCPDCQEEVKACEYNRDPNLTRERYSMLP
jgi:hypothetical protein